MDADDDALRPKTFVEHLEHCTETLGMEVAQVPDPGERPRRPAVAKERTGLVNDRAGDIVDGGRPLEPLGVASDQWPSWSWMG